MANIWEHHSCGFHTLGMWVKTCYSQPRPIDSCYVCLLTLYQSHHCRRATLLALLTLLGVISIKDAVSPQSCAYRSLSAPMPPPFRTHATCRSISAKLISIRAMNLCQKPTGTKLILNTRWMVLAIGCRILWVSSPGLEGRRCGRR